MQYCTIQYNSVLYYTVQYNTSMNDADCTPEYSTVLFYTVQYITVMYTADLYCTVDYYIVLISHLT